MEASLPVEMASPLVELGLAQGRRKRIPAGEGGKGMRLTPVLCSGWKDCERGSVCVLCTCRTTQGLVHSVHSIPFSSLGTHYACTNPLLSLKEQLWQCLMCVPLTQA